jgi:hypothetical protein
MEEFFAFLIFTVVDVVVVFTGRAVLALLTLGYWRGERANGDEGRVFGAAGSLSFKRDGQRVLTVTGLWLLGSLFYIAALILAFLLLIG